jgi:hypothetical protein
VLSQFVFYFAHGFSFQCDAVAVVNEPITDGIGDGGVGDQLMPVAHRQLAGDQGGTQAMAVFKDLQQIVLLLGAEALEAPVVKYLGWIMGVIYRLLDKGCHISIIDYSIDNRDMTPSFGSPSKSLFVALTIVHRVLF